MLTLIFSRHDCTKILPIVQTISKLYEAEQ